MSLRRSRMPSRIPLHPRPIVPEAVPPLGLTRVPLQRRPLPRRLHRLALAQTRPLLHVVFNHHGLDCLQPSHCHERRPILPITPWLRHTITIRITMPRCERLCQRYSLVLLRSEVLPSNMNLRLHRLPIDRQERRVSLPPSDWFPVPTSLMTASFPWGCLGPLDMPGPQRLD